MKLSDAMVLGDSLRTRNSDVYLMKKRDGSYCGCAIGGAFLAAAEDARPGHIDEYISSHWPWLDEDHPSLPCLWRSVIGRHREEGFQAVMDGKITFEQFIQYIKSVEPECGQCNTFKCQCQAVDANPTEVNYEKEEAGICI